MAPSAVSACRCRIVAALLAGCASNGSRAAPPLDASSRAGAKPAAPRGRASGAAAGRAAASSQFWRASGGPRAAAAAVGVAVAIAVVARSARRLSELRMAVAAVVKVAATCAS